MTTAALNFSVVQKNLQAKIDSIDLPEVNWKAVCFAGIFMCLSLLIFYVWQVNELTRGTYVVNNYLKEISKLSEENKNLQISFAESSFLGEALAKIQALDFQKVTSVKYIQISDNSVATIQKANVR